MVAYRKFIQGVIFGAPENGLVFCFHCITLFDDSHSTGWAEIWGSEVESNKGKNVSAPCKNPNGSLAGKGLMEDAISKMMGRPKPWAEPGGEADEREAPLPADGAAGAPAQPPGAAGTSPLEASAARAKAAASPTKECSAGAGAGAGAATPSLSRRRRVSSGEAAASDI